MRLQGELDREALGSALTELVRRHEVLRTTFTTHEGQAVQHIHAPGPQPLPVIDLRGVSERLAEARRIAGEEASRPFDLSAGPLLRALLWTPWVPLWVPRPCYVRHMYLKVGGAMPRNATFPQPRRYYLQ